MGTGNGVLSGSWDCLSLRHYFPHFSHSNVIITIFAMSCTHLYYLLNNFHFDLH